MSLADDVKVPIRHADRFFIGGQWVQPSSDATIKVIHSGTEELFFSVAEAQAADISRAVEAARQAFDACPWPRLTHAERAGYLRAIGAELSRRSDDIGQIWPRESGVLHGKSPSSTQGWGCSRLEAATLPVPPTAGLFQDRSLKPDGYDEQLSPRTIRCTAPAALLSELIPRHISRLQEDGLLFSRMMIVTTQKSV